MACKNVKEISFTGCRFCNVNNYLIVHTLLCVQDLSLQH